MKKRKHQTILFRLVSLLFCIVLISSMMPVYAAEKDNTHTTVKVGFFAMDGYHMENKAGERSGYGYEFLQLLARYSNLRFEYVGYDKGWDEMLRMLENGEIDLLTSAQRTPEREEKFDYSETLIGTSAAILTVKAGDTRYNDGNYNDMRVGLIKNNSRNALLDDYMKQHGFTYKAVYFECMDDVTAALQKGTEIDGAMTSNLRRSENEWTLEELNSSPYYAIVKKGNNTLLSEVNAAIDRMDTDSAGWRTKLFNKFYTMDSGEVVAFTGEERLWLDELAAKGRILTVTVNPDCAPYSYFKDGKACGIIPDIFDEVAERMGIRYEMIEPSDSEEYQKICKNGEVDIILDGLEDLYTIEVNGLEISDVYYTAPMAALTNKSNSSDIKSLARTESNLLNEDYYSNLYEGKTIDEKHCLTLDDCADRVKSGTVDGSYMPLYCAQWLSLGDVSGKLQYLMLPQYDRAFVYAVSANEDYQLLSALNKAVGSLSEDSISAIVIKDTEYQERGFSLQGFIYQNPLMAAGFIILLIFVGITVLFLVEKNRRAQKELQRSRRLERYIGYLCDMYDKVLEVDLDLKNRKQYIKTNGIVEIQERNDFTGFDIDSIYPDDVEECLSVFEPVALRSLDPAGEDERYIECRMKTPEGEYRWYSFLLKHIRRDHEHPCSAMLLIKDIDDLYRERQHNREALLNALDAANTASRSKSTFLSSMSHEIRTPLNAMIGYMTIAQNAVDNREKVAHCIESAGIAARHLLSIINDVLDISSMESGKMKIMKERFDLKELLSSVTSIFYQQCRQKDIKFVITVNGLTEEWIIGDSMRVNQILMNLLSNAVKFTDNNGSVNVNVTQTKLSENQVFIRFIVKDTGIGMSEEYLGRLFTPFEQESAETARKYGGTGLGMSITFNLVSLMGGNIDVKSKEGKGTTFTITLPFGRTENKETHAISQDLSKLHILVVDDMENECDYVHTLLTRCGVLSETAHSGEEAIKMVALKKDTPEKFDMCIIDWNMPGLNGVETTKLIHEECDPNIPIIIATAYDISEFEEAAMAAGASKIIAKPLFQSTLFDLLVSTYGKYDVIPEDNSLIPDLKGMRVLLAEDNEMNIDVAVDLLELAGITTDVVHNGQEAVDMFFANSADYDVILMDVQMPVMDGYAATKEIRMSDLPQAKSIPIIAMTANAFAEDVSASLAAGMNGHLSKPIETVELFNTLQKIMKK